MTVIGVPPWSSSTVAWEGVARRGTTTADTPGCWDWSLTCCFVRSAGVPRAAEAIDSFQPLDDPTVFLVECGWDYFPHEP